MTQTPPLAGTPQSAAKSRLIKYARMGMFSFCALVPIFSADGAKAQSGDTGTLINPDVPTDYDRGRNVSVTERPRPDYDPLGLRFGGFRVFPSAKVALGYTNNVFLAESNPRSDAFADLSTSVLALSNWSRHRVRLRASTDVMRFVDTPRRNQQTFDAGAMGQFDYNSQLSFVAEAQLGRLFESPLTGSIDGSDAILSSYLRSYFSGAAHLESGRIRGTLSFDRTGFAFSDINLGATVRNQADRDRVASRVTFQGEYARSPAVSYYTRLTAGRTGYSHLLANGQPNRDAYFYRAVAGLSLDIPGVIRGVVGAGVSHNAYDSSIYRDITGFSAEAKLEFFPTELTTFSLTASRTVEDSSISNSSAYYDNRLTASVDHELLRNLILSAVGEVGRLDYIGSPLKTDVWRGGLKGRYLSSPLLELNGEMSYSARNSSNSAINPSRSEFKIQFGVVLHP